MSEKFKSMEKMAAVLECFSVSRRRLSVLEIARQTGYPRPTVHRIVSALRDIGFIEQDRDRENYRLGVKLFQFGTAVLSTLDLRRDAAPIVEDIVRATGQKVHLSVFDGLNSTVITRSTLDSSQTNVMYVLDASPAYATASGKVALAYQDEETIGRFLTLPMMKFTPNTITDPQALRAELKAIREKGYAEDNQELNLGTNCVAGPILGASQRVFAAISISGAEKNFYETNRLQFIDIVTTAAARISNLLGYVSPASSGSQPKVSHPGFALPHNS